MANLLRSAFAVFMVFAALFCTMSTIRSMISAESAGLRGSPAAVPTRQELGHSTWTLLHRTAAKYGETPSAAQQQQMRTFIHTLGDLYPCDDCATHFRAMLQESPPAVDSGASLRRWMCERHNQVNQRLGKPVFRCDEEHLKERWGDCGCSETATPSNNA